VVRSAASGGLDVIAITDHDTTAAYHAAWAVGREVRVQVVPGIEVSSTHAGRDVHILGYFVNPDAAALVAHGEHATTRREERMREMIVRLSDEAITVSYSEVEEAAGPDRVTIGRPHLARALVSAGYATSVPDAFNRLIGDRSASFVPTGLLEPQAAVELVLAGGGIPIWAHPPGDMVDGLLPELISAGLRGLEVYRPSHRRNAVLRYEAICKSAGLMQSGGSDWHTPDAGKALGDFFVDGQEIEELLSAGGI